MAADSADAFSPTIWLTASCRASRFSRCFCCVTSRSRQRTASGSPALLTPAQAQLELQHAPVGGVVAQRRPLDGFAVQRAAEERGYFVADALCEDILKVCRERARPPGIQPESRFQAGLA